MKLEDYLKKEFARSGAIDFSIRATVNKAEEVEFYIHATGKDSDTVNYYVDGNQLTAVSISKCESNESNKNNTISPNIPQGT